MKKYRLIEKYVATYGAVYEPQEIGCVSYRYFLTRIYNGKRQVLYIDPMKMVKSGYEGIVEVKTTVSINHGKQQDVSELEIDFEVKEEDLETLKRVMQDKDAVINLRRLNVHVDEKKKTVTITPLGLDVNIAQTLELATDAQIAEETRKRFYSPKGKAKEEKLELLTAEDMGEENLENLVHKLLRNQGRIIARLNKKGDE